MVRDISIHELETLVAQGADLIDVRESEQCVEEGLPGRTHCPLSRLSELKSRISTTGPTVFYCRSGLMSYQAAEIAADWTPQPVYYLAGGLIESSEPESAGAEATAWAVSEAQT